MSLILICITWFCAVVPIQSLAINAGKREDVISDLSTTDSTSSELTWEELMNVLKSENTFGSRTLNLTSVISTVNITRECRQSLKKFVTSLEDWETWAIRMADANGRLPSGIMDGRLASLGSFDECLKIRVGSPELFRGQYCLLAMRSPLLADVYDNEVHRNKGYEDTYGEPPQWVEDYLATSRLFLKNMFFFVGICVPSTCSEADVNTIASHVLKPIGFEVSRYDCQKEEQVIWLTPEIVAMSFIALIAVLCLLGTTADIVGTCFIFENQKCKNLSDSLLSYLRVFSVPSNTAKLFAKGSGKSFACFDGLRFFSFVCILAFHAGRIPNETELALHRNSFVRMEGWSAYLRAAVIMDGGLIPVDTFFCISGFLLVSTTWEKLELSNGRLNILKFMLNKYLRLTPAHALAVSLWILTYKLGSGPFWNSFMRPEYEVCRTNWWQNFLYINNCFGPKLCLVTTWFLSALMQCHLIGVILLFISYRWPIKGIILGASTVVGAFAYVAWVTVTKNYPLPNMFTFTDISFRKGFYTIFHQKTYAHVCCYVIGMVFGYIHLKRKTDYQIKWKLFGWILAAVSGVYAVCGRYCFPDERAAVLVYHVFHRAVWAASMGWLIHACCSGQGGVVDRLLSWQGFEVFSKLSYLAYLLHAPVIVLQQWSGREVTTYGDFNFSLEVLGFATATFFVSAVAYVTVEQPFGTITTRIFKRK